MEAGKIVILESDYSSPNLVGILVCAGLVVLDTLWKGGHPMEGQDLALLDGRKNLCSASETVSTPGNSSWSGFRGVVSTCNPILEFCHYFAQLGMATRLGMPTFETINVCERTDHVFFGSWASNPFGGARDKTMEMGVP